MSLKTACVLAFVGMFLLTALAVVDLIRDASGVARDVVPAIRLLRSFVYMFASATVTLFLYVFYKRQS